VTTRRSVLTVGVLLAAVVFLLAAAVSAGAQPEPQPHPTPNPQPAPPTTTPTPTTMPTPNPQPGPPVSTPPTPSPQPGGQATPAQTVPIECSNFQYPLGWLGDAYAWFNPLLPSDTETVQVDGRPEWQWWRDEILLESAAGENGCDLAGQPPQITCGQWSATPGGYRTWGLLPDQCWGSYPSVLYEMNWDDGNWYDVTQYGERISGWLGGFFFLVGRMSVQAMLWLLHWAYRFNIRDYSNLADELGDRYDREIVGPWGLKDIAWFFLMVYVGFLALRRRVGAAGGELLLSVVLLGLATVLIAKPVFYIDTVADTLDLASNELLATARPQELDDPLGEEEEKDEEADLLGLACARWGEGHSLEAMLCQLHVEFVERPYLYMNAGTEHLSDGCFTAVQNVLSTGRDEDGWPTRYMERAGCPREVVDWNRGVSGTRMMSALLLVLVALIVATFLGLLAFTVLVAKFLVVLLFALLPFIVVCAVLPGSGRRIAWSWVATVVQCLLMALSMSALLSLLMLSLTELIRRTDGELHILQRWGLILLIVCVISFTRKRIIGGAQSIANRLADSMTRISPAMSNWSGGGSVGLDFERADRVVRRTALGATYGAAAGLAFMSAGLHRRAVERRVAFRGYLNMERLERSREGGFDEWRVDTYRYGNRPPSVPGELTIGGRSEPLTSRGGVTVADLGKLRTGRSGGGSGGGGGGRGGGLGPIRFKTPTGGTPVDGEWRQRNEVLYRTRRSPGFGWHSIRHPFHAMGGTMHRRRVARQARSAQAEFLRGAGKGRPRDALNFYRRRGFP